ncbi:MULTISPECIES: hypothetical protein [Herbaspirillum]|uniref:Uncharacterized protein n=2 Tax=Herbaspirillum huttiense TaxID=863372 RepID=A0AAJ2H9Z9_9BURK|nr:MULTISPECIES: hypothetical protein [Herbaspirillum]MDR9836802.1 hypothetical protein [Herbaspirillum huttiense]
MQAKDIPEVPVLQFLASLEESPATWVDNNGAFFDNSIQRGMPSGVPAKVALAKMAAMIRKGLVNGCACGCRGDFLITDQGRTMLTAALAQTTETV